MCQCANDEIKAKAKVKKVKSQRSKVFVPKFPVNYQLTFNPESFRDKSSISQNPKRETRNPKCEPTVIDRREINPKRETT